MISWWWPSLVWPRGFRRVGKLVFSNPSKISPDISWLYSMIPTPDQHFTSSAFFQTRCNSFVLSLQPSIIAESKIIHFSIHGDFTLVRWIFHLNNGGWIGRDEFFKRVSEFVNFRIAMEMERQIIMFRPGETCLSCLAHKVSEWNKDSFSFVKLGTNYSGSWETRF